MADDVKEPDKSPAKDREPERLDAPNQQVVRPDGSGPGDEGKGGSKPRAKPGPKPAAKTPAPPADSHPKDDKGDAS